MGLVTQLVPAQRLLDDARGARARDRGGTPRSRCGRRSRRSTTGSTCPRGGARAREPAVPGLPRDEGSGRGAPRVRGEAAAGVRSGDPAEAGRARHRDGRGRNARRRAPTPEPDERIERELARIERGGAERYHAKNAEQGSSSPASGSGCCSIPARSSRTARSRTRSIRAARRRRRHGMGRVGGRPVCVMANDSTVKAGAGAPGRSRRSSASRRSRPRRRSPCCTSSTPPACRPGWRCSRAGAAPVASSTTRSTSPGRPAGLPCSSARPRQGATSRRSATSSSWSRNASMYLGSPRMAEMVIGEKVTLEELGGARMHCSVSGCGDFLVADRGGGDRARAAAGLHLPQSHRGLPPPAPTRHPRAGGRAIEEIVPRDQNRPFDMVGSSRRSWTRARSSR